METSVKQQKKKLRSLQNESGLLKKTTKKLMRNFAEEQTVAQRSAAKLVKRVAIRFVWMEMCISKV